jgi:hypothetical protein
MRAAPGGERAWATALLAAHAALALWGAAMTSVTFDENFHVPAGAFIAARRDFDISFAQPPLAKTCARCPRSRWGRSSRPTRSFPRPGPDRGGPGGRGLHAHQRRPIPHALLRRALHHHPVLSSRSAGWCGVSRAGSTDRAARCSRSRSTLSPPEAVAHAGIAGVDMATGLVMTAAVYAFWRFARTTRWRDAAILALFTGLAFLTRFSAVQLAPVLVLLAVLGMALGRIRRPGRVWLALALLPVTTLVIFNLGYLCQTSFAPLGERALFSPRFQAMQRVWPWLRPPVPDAALRGLDYLSFLSESPETRTYLLGKVRTDSPWTYFPIALAVKWPLGFIGALGLCLARRVRERPGRKRIWNECVLLVPVAVVLGSAMVAHLNVGIRYVFPVLPLLCVWCGAVAGPRCRARAEAQARRRAPALPARPRRRGRARRA